MSSRKALAKLKAILIIDLLVVLAAGGSYLYLLEEGQITAGAPKPAEFEVKDLTINPLETEIFEPVLITANLTNIGDEQGGYDANLTINGVIEQNQTIWLMGGESVLIEFTVSKEQEGTYVVDIGGLSGSLKINVPPPTSSHIGLSKLVVNPFEGWVDEPIAVTVSATNTGGEAESLTVKLMVDDSLISTKKVELEAGESTTVEFTFNVTTEGKHTIKVNSLSGTVNIVPTGYHTLNVNRSGGGSKPLTFTLNGVPINTPYIELLPVGEYTVTVPNIVDIETGILEFSYWNDGSKSTSRTFTLDRRLLLVATYTVISGWASCPSLYYWNGTHYVYVTEVSNSGWLGYLDYINEKGDIVFGGGNPWDYVKLDDSLSLRETDSKHFYELVLFQQWDEISYLDAAYLTVVDHPIGTDVYSTMTNYYNDAFNGQIYTVSKNNLLTPISATNEKGEDVLFQISKLDGIFTPGNNGFVSPSWDNITLNQLTLNLGNLSTAQEIKLVIRGMVDWGPADPYYEWIDKFKTGFAEGLVPNGTQLNPPPYMEVLDANGNWMRVSQDRQIPIPSDFVPRDFVVDLTGLFPENISDYQLRITNFFNVTFDYIGIDISAQENISVQTIKPTGILGQLEFGTVASNASGNFTRYGDVTALLQEADDLYVIGMQGDKVTLLFPADNLTPVEEGMERDVFLFVACWFKDPPGNWGYGFEFTVDPLPFMAMSGFPYPPTESFPYDTTHVAYLQEYNTRYVAPKP